MSPAPPRRIRVLRDAVARKIAAGEVVDRPQAVIRELLDNSLDAECTRIDVFLEAGGLKSLQVVDNGRGMSVEDLELCCLPHATSKIESEDDLQKLTSLGFRGEALASVAACSRLTITTAEDESGLAHQLSLEEGRQSLQKISGVRGTRVLVEDLFYNLPARKRFLKSSAAEGLLCRRVLEEKALAFPQVSFHLWMDGVLKDQLPPQSLEDRLREVSGSPWKEESVLHGVATAEGYRLEVFALPPSQFRNDRKGVRIYANKRPLQEFALVQAATFAFEGHLPGGAFPWVAVFLDVDPALVDFNIHPAKREARFRNLPALRQGVIETLRGLLGEQKLRSPLFEGEPLLDLPLPLANQPTLRGRGQFPSTANWDPSPLDSDVVRETPAEGFRYLGQVLGVFLVAELGDEVFLIDQHAAHERLLYDRFRADGSEGQELLVAYPFFLEEDTELEDEDLAAYAALGVGLRKLGPGSFELLKLPQTVASMEKQVISFIQDRKRPVEDLEKDLYARLSCRAAVMDGDPLDPVSAREIIRGALKLDNARCPHGRPIWTRLSRKELFEKVGRLV